MFKRRQKVEALPYNVRLAQEAVVDRLAARLDVVAGPELLDWIEASALGCDAALRVYRDDPNPNTLDSLHALAEQLFALTFTLQSREVERKRGSASHRRDPGSSV